MVKTTKTTVKKAPAAKKSADAAGAQKAVKSDGLTASVLGADGKVKGKMTLPEELFGQKVNKDLIAQAIRVHQANQRAGGAATKTRGMVRGSTRKIFKQKGTGRARHGGIRAPIFVGGGIAFGPVPHDFSLSLPVVMKRKALASALSAQYSAGNVVIMDDLAALEPKTKNMVEALAAVGDRTSLLLVLSKESMTVGRIARNIADVDVMPYVSLNTYDVIMHQKIVIMKDAVSQMKEVFLREKNA